MTKINYIPASHGHVQPTKLAIRLFFYSYSGGGLQWFAYFSSFSPPIVSNSGGGLWWFEVVCGGLWWFAVVCGGLRWFVMVCGGLSYRVIPDGLCTSTPISVNDLMIGPSGEG